MNIASIANTFKSDVIHSVWFTTVGAEEWVNCYYLLMADGSVIYIGEHCDFDPPLRTNKPNEAQRLMCEQLPELCHVEGARLIAFVGDRLNRVLYETSAGCIFWVHPGEPSMLLEVEPTCQVLEELEPPVQRALLNV